MFSMTKQKVVIIGGSYGMGLATAEMAIAAGAEVAIAARGADKLAAASAALERRGGRAVPWRALRIEDRPAVASFLAEFAPFDHLVLPGSTVKPLAYDALTDDNAREAFDSKYCSHARQASSRREMIMRWISEVPSTISSTLASPKARDTGNSLMIP